MVVPKKKLSESKRRIKRSGEKISEVSTTRCQTCGVLIVQHFACIRCFKAK